MKNEITIKDDNLMINPLSGEVFDPISGEYVLDHSPYNTINDINLRLGKFIAEHNDEFSDADGANICKAINGIFGNRVEYLLISVLKEYETSLAIKEFIYEDLSAKIIHEIRSEFWPIFNLLDYELISENGCRINDILAEFMINYLVSSIMNKYLLYTKVSNDTSYIPFVISNYGGTALIALRLHHVFETIFTELKEYYRPTLACLDTIGEE